MTPSLQVRRCGNCWGAARSLQRSVWATVELSEFGSTMSLQFMSGPLRCALNLQLVAATRLLPVLHSRSEKHTSELQSRLHLVCRLLLEKKKKKNTINCMYYNVI